MRIYKTLCTRNNEFWNILSIEKYAGNSESASEKEKFDFYIKKSFVDGNTYLPSLKITDASTDFGFYIKRYKMFYDRYLSNNLRLEEKLSDEIKNYYANGKGNEFITGKFYSVASSSRFATSCFSKNINEKLSLVDNIDIEGKNKNCIISLEYNLNIHSKNGNIISNPQMDVVIKSGSNDVYFIEAKCHEIFDNHHDLKLKWEYMNSEFINSILPSNLNISRLRLKNKNYIAKSGNILSAKDFGCTLKTFHFDFKQFLCHLMGILDYKKTHTENIHFYYLFYKNAEYEEKENPNIYIELEAELKSIFDVFGEKYPNIDFGYFYYNKFDTLENIVNYYEHQ